MINDIPFDSGSNIDSEYHIFFSPQTQNAPSYGRSNSPFIATIKELSLSENSNGHNSVHIQPIWMKDLPQDSLARGLSNDVYLVPGHGS